MEKQKIAVIGANAAITPLIEKAKECGYETHVFAWKCGALGETAADFFYGISVSEREKILEKCREIGVCAVCTITSDFAAPVADFVARNMGLACNPQEAEVLARDKYRMRTAFKKAGLYTPHFVKTDKNADLTGFTFPVIVKPTDAWSSKGITRVDCEKDIESAIAYAAQYSTDNCAIIEEFMEGPEYSAECICYNGESCVLAFTQKETTGYPHYVETGHKQPADISESVRERAKAVIAKALSALQIRNGAAHAEFKVLPSGEIGIIEIGARMGGDYIGTYLTKLSTGTDYVKMVIDVALGKKPDFSVVQTPVPAKVKFILSQSDLDEFYRFSNERASDIVAYGDIDKDFAKGVENSGDRHGYYIFKCSV